MLLTKEKAEEIINDYKSNITDAYRSKLLFITDLITNDDWTFVIKAHALIESVMNELVEVYLEKPEIKEVIGKLPLHGGSGSKISIAKKLHSISSEESRFVSNFSELRNILVHRFEYIDFTFDSYVQNLNKEQLEKLNTALRINANQPDIYIIERTCNNLQIKLSYWNAIFNLLVNLIDRIHLKIASDRNEKEAVTTTMGLISNVFKDSQKNFTS